MESIVNNRKSVIRIIEVLVLGILITGPSVTHAQEVNTERLIEASGVTGGLVVRIGSTDRTLTEMKEIVGPYLVQGLSTKPGHSVRRFDGKTLPYVDGLVNLLIDETNASMPNQELMRVITPGGVLLTRYSDSNTTSLSNLTGWYKATKPVPEDTDEWTHFLHGPDGHVMSEDRAVASPHHIQWIGAPTHGRSHARLTTVNVMVTGGGRLFYIVDEGSTALPDALPSRWTLAARDAYNGLVLWKRPLTRWQPYHVKDRNSYPADLHRRLVIGDNRVFVTLSILGPVSALDPATGKTIRVFANTEQTEDIIYDQGTLYLIINEANKQAINRRLMAYRHVEPQDKRIMAIRARDGKVLWTKSDRDTDGLMPMTLASKNGRLYFQNPQGVVCIEARSGKRVWQSDRPSEYFRPGWSSPTLVAFDDVVISADRQSGPTQKIGKDQFAAGGFSTGDLVAFSASTGERLWSTLCAEGCRAPTDVFGLDGRLWYGETLQRQDNEYRKAVDLRTGELLNEWPIYGNWPTQHHHRCYRDKATPNYILGSRTGVEFIDLKTGELTQHNWIRGNCKFGILPANGLLYLPPEQCGCYVESKLTGFHALAGKRGVKGEVRRVKKGNNRLVKGPAYKQFPPSLFTPHTSNDWPTYRGDNARSGRMDSRISTDLQESWRTPIGSKLTQAVIADNRLFVASIDQHTLYALDARNGQPLYRFQAGARIDSPPTVCANRVVFGCSDGWVYALCSTNGSLAWRFRVAPDDTQLVVKGQLESVWPVHGAVMIQDKIVYCAAGRSSYVDGGVYMVKLDLITGRLLQEKIFYSRDPKSGQSLPLYEPFAEQGLAKMEMPGVLPDVLSSDGKHLWMRAVTFDTDLTIQNTYPAHLFSSAGFLDDSWWELSYWMYGKHMFGGRSGIARATGLYPTARLMVCDTNRIYGSQEGYDGVQTPQFIASGKEPVIKPIKQAKKKKKSGRVLHDWQKEVPLHVFGLVLAGDTLFMAGPPRIDAVQTQTLLETIATDEYEPASLLADAFSTFTGAKGGLLYALDKTNGKPVMKHTLATVPVFDGLSAASGRLYLATRDGQVVCFVSESQ
jgi:outer membrane protein assembly factor BamB